jgi:hypothetical protein
MINPTCPQTGGNYSQNLGQNMQNFDAGKSPTISHQIVPNRTIGPVNRTTAQSTPQIQPSLAQTPQSINNNEPNQTTQ